MIKRNTENIRIYLSWIKSYLSNSVCESGFIVMINQFWRVQQRKEWKSIEDTNKNNKRYLLNHIFFY